MVKYVSPTCGPCKILSPILDKVVQEYADKIHFVEIDIVADPEIAQMGQVTIHQIERNERTAVAQMNVIVYRWATNVHSNPWRCQCFENFFASGKGII